MPSVEFQIAADNFADAKRRALEIAEQYFGTTDYINLRLEASVEFRADQSVDHFRVACEAHSADPTT